MTSKACDPTCKSHVFCAAGSTCCLSYSRILYAIGYNDQHVAFVWKLNSAYLCHTTFWTITITSTALTCECTYHERHTIMTMQLYVCRRRGKTTQWHHRYIKHNIVDDCAWLAMPTWHSRPHIVTHSGVHLWIYTSWHNLLPADWIAWWSWVVVEQWELQVAGNFCKTYDVNDMLTCIFYCIPHPRQSSCLFTHSIVHSVLVNLERTDMVVWC